MGWNGGTQSSFHPVQLGSMRKNGLRNHWHPHWQGSGNTKKLRSLLELFTLLGPIMARNYACWFLFWATNVVKLHQFRLLWWYHVVPTGRGCSPAASCVKNFWMISFASLTPRQRMLGKSTTLSIFALSSPNFGEMLQKSSRWRIIH